MRIAIYGPGPIGSTFAFHLARAGHDVTVIARGRRLAYLEQERAIVTTQGERAPVEVRAALDPATPWDLVLVTVLDSQVDAVLPALRDSAAKQVMFMFNTFEPFDRLRDAVGAQRFAFGFPAILADFQEDGRLKTQVIPRSRFSPQLTTVTHANWAEVFTKAGIDTDTEADMHSWLRTHAALVVPVILISDRVHKRGTPLSWSEAKHFAEGMVEGVAVVRSLGHALKPAPVAIFSKLPASALTPLLWLVSRSASVMALGHKGPGEAHTLMDSMIAAAPTRAATLRALRAA
ncbi:MAG: 2-dehydropantoate 2-reductase N-terminal domain-containing protein [Cystobacter sp.]